MDPLALAAFLSAVLTSAAAVAQHAQGDAHANPHGGAIPGTFEATPDDVAEDDSVPEGTIAVRIVGPENAPLSAIPVTLAVVTNTVAKGESRQHLSRATSDSGEVVFDKLEIASSTSYRLSVVRDGGQFAVPPFQLPRGHGIRAVLHVYPVTTNLADAMVVSEGALFVELRDDRVQLHEAFRIHNFGRTAWVPSDVLLRLPEGFTALTAQESMSSAGIQVSAGQGALLKGTFGPGSNVVEFRWQLPYAGTPTVDMTVGMAPHLASMRVVAAAGEGMHLVVEGFPTAQPQEGQGGRVLVTQKQLGRDEQNPLRISLRDIPTVGPARLVVVAFAGLVVALGIALGTRRDRTLSARTARTMRASLLEDLEELERARVAGDVGPKTYERSRREIIDAIARTLFAEKNTSPDAVEKARESAEGDAGV